MLDSDIAKLFGVETEQLNRQMKRNVERFPKEFCFKLNSVEFKNLKCQNGISSSSHGDIRKTPYAYTEHDIIAIIKSIVNLIK